MRRKTRGFVPLKGDTYLMLKSQSLEFGDPWKRIHGEKILLILSDPYDHGSSAIGFNRPRLFVDVWEQDVGKFTCSIEYLMCRSTTRLMSNMKKGRLKESQRCYECIAVPIWGARWLRVEEKIDEKS